MSRKKTRAEWDICFAEADPWGYRTCKDDLTRRDIILAHLPQGVKSIIDLGCGEGFITERLSVGRLVGVDITWKALKRCSFKGEKYRCDIFSDDVLVLGKFDLVLATGVLYGATDEDIERLIGLMEPGGFLLSCHIAQWSYNLAALNRLLFLMREKKFAYREFQEYLGLYRRRRIDERGAQDGD